MNIGTILIYISLAVSIVSLFFLAKSARGDANSLMSAERLFYLSGITIVFTSILLLVAFLTGSFNFSYVYSYSSKDMHFIYKIAAFWAGQEGTFLLWILLLFIFGALVIRKKDEDENIVLSIVIITQIFILIVLCIHSPFKYVWQAFPNRFRPGIAPPDGSGLNPLLLDPWMIVHPPVLFLGYASATIPFAYAIAALLKKDYKSWVQRSYNWLLFCMTSLGIGIFLGAYWAYKVLGWGGYWGWDPVENSSLIPWLIIVALMHGLYIQKRKNILVKSNLFMAIISFVLIFYGTFLTRSGVLSDFSVHSFADLGLSGYLIFFIIFFLFIGVFLFIKRFKEIETSQLSNKILTLENLLTYGILTLCVYSLFILTGTSMPILSKIFLSNPTSVSIKFYNTISIPLGIFILSFLILATFYQFKKDINKKNIILITSISVISGILLNVFHTKSISAYIFITLGLFIIIQNIINLIKYKTENIISSRLAHIGVGFLVIGFITSNIHSFAVQKILPMGVEKDIESVNLTFNGITKEKEASLFFTFKEGGNSKEIKTKYYINRKTNSLYREPYISYGFLKDIYVSPVNYKSGTQNIGKIDLLKDKEREIDGMKITFTGFKIDKEHMRSGNPKLFANLKINIDGKVYTLSPGLRIRTKNMKEKIDVKIPNTNRKISLLDFDIRHKKVLIFVEPGKEIKTPSASAIVEVSFKRLIWFVWLGTVLISISGFFALRRSWRSS